MPYPSQLLQTSSSSLSPPPLVHLGHCLSGRPWARRLIYIYLMSPSWFHKDDSWKSLRLKRKSSDWLNGLLGATQLLKWSMVLILPSYPWQMLSRGSSFPSQLLHLLISCFAVWLSFLSDFWPHLFWSHSLALWITQKKFYLFKYLFSQLSKKSQDKKDCSYPECEVSSACHHTSVDHLHCPEPCAGDTLRVCTQIGRGHSSWLNVSRLPVGSLLLLHIVQLHRLPPSLDHLIEVC